MPKLDSMLPDVLKKQMIQVTGVPGSGKTTFSIQLDFPHKTCLADMELQKGETIVNQYKNMEFQGIMDASDRSKTVDNLVAFIKKFKPGEKTVLVLDNFVDFEDCLGEWVYKNADEVVKAHPNMSTKNIKAMNQGFGQYYKAMELKEMEIFRLIFERFETLVCTAHLSPVFKQPGKLKIKGRPIWLNYSVLSVILMKSKDLTSRHAIVYKESISKHEPVDYKNLTEKQLQQISMGLSPSSKIIRVIPPRIPEFSADKLRYLIHHPIGDNLSSENVPTMEEVSPFDSILSSEQIQALADLADQIEEKEEAELEQQAQQRYDDMISFIKSELGQGKLPKEVIESSRTEYPEYANEIDMPMVAEYME